MLVNGTSVHLSLTVKRSSCLLKATKVKSRGSACRKVEILSSNILQFSNYFLAFRFFLLLYLLVPTYTTFILEPSCQNFHYFNISFDNPWQPFVVYRSPALIIAHRTRVVNPQLTTRRSHQLHFGFTHAHHNLLIMLLSLSTHLSSLPVRSSADCLARPQPYLTSTQTYIHLNNSLLQT